MKVLISLLFVLTACASGDPVEAFIAGKTEVAGVENSQQRYGQFREPGLLTLKSGRLVIVTQARDHSKWSDRSGQDLVASYSDDEGKSWSKPVLAAEHGNSSICPNACVYDEITDKIHVLYNLFPWDFNIGHKGYKELKKNGKLKKESCRQFQITSKDGGETWSKPEDVSSMFKAEGAIVVFGSGKGIQLKNGKNKGRLVIPGGPRFPKWGNTAFYSDDHGRTWQSGAIAIKTSESQKMNVRNECKIAEIGNQLVMNCRSMPFRTAAFSNDAGVSWSEYKVCKDLPMASTNAALITVNHNGKDYLAFACAAGPGRLNGMLCLSDDAGKTWQHRKLVAPGTFAYCSMSQLKNGKIGLVYETEVYHGGSYKNLKFMTVDPDDVLGVKDQFPKDRKDPNADL
jgi:sialidase-1